MDRVDKAVRKIRDRLQVIEAAKADLRIVAQPRLTMAERSRQPLAHQVWRNRLGGLLIAIAHLKDDVKRLAKARGLSTGDIDDFCRTSPAIVLCAKAADTIKHGMGGRSGNNTVIAREIVVVKTPQGKPPSENSESIVAGSLIVDENGDGHDSSILSDSAIRAWLDYIAKAFDLHFDEGRQRVVPKPSRPTVVLGQEHAVIPPGAQLIIPLSPSVRDELRKESTARGGVG